MARELETLFLKIRAEDESVEGDLRAIEDDARSVVERIKNNLTGAFRGFKRESVEEFQSVINTLKPLGICQMVIAGHATEFGHSAG